MIIKILGMYKVVIQTEEYLPTYNSDTFRIINESEEKLSPLETSPIKQFEGFIGNAHLFRNITTQSEGLFYQMKSRLLYITNSYAGIEKALKDIEEEVEICRKIRKEIKIDSMKIGQSEDLILIFKSITMAEQIYNSVKKEEGNTNSFPFYIQQIAIYSQKPTIPEQLYKKVILDEQNTKQIWIEIPTCSSCLNLLEQEVTGTILQKKSKEKDKINLKECKVCWLMSKGEASCPECSQKEDNWICMICGAIGCGRYKNADAYKHYLQTKHFLSLDLQTYRIWNYKQDCFSHKVLGKEEHHLEMSEGNQNLKAGQENLQTAFWKYCCVVSEQLDKQRNFYQTIKQDEVMRLDQEEKILDKKIEELTKIKEENLQALKRKTKRNKKVDKKQRQLEERCGEERTINSSLEESAKSEKNVMESKQIERKRKELEEVEKQIEQILLTLK